VAHLSSARCRQALQAALERKSGAASTVPQPTAATHCAAAIQHQTQCVEGRGVAPRAARGGAPAVALSAAQQLCARGRRQRGGPRADRPPGRCGQVQQGAQRGAPHDLRILLALRRARHTALHTCGSARRTRAAQRVAPGCPLPGCAAPRAPTRLCTRAAQPAAAGCPLPGCAAPAPLSKEHSPFTLRAIRCTERKARGSLGRRRGGCARCADTSANLAAARPLAMPAPSRARWYNRHPGIASPATSWQSRRTRAGRPPHPRQVQQQLAQQQAQPRAEALRLRLRRRLRRRLGARCGRAAGRLRGRRAARGRRGLRRRRPEEQLAVRGQVVRQVERARAAGRRRARQHPARRPGLPGQLGVLQEAHPRRACTHKLPERSALRVQTGLHPHCGGGSRLLASVGRVSAAAAPFGHCLYTRA